MKKATLHLDALTCPSCVMKISNAVKGLAGVDKDSVNVLFNASKVKVDFDEAQLSAVDIEKSITTLGYDVKKVQVK
ncbi:MAG: heavy-metal-associated domain-containing protein [Eubacteriales bacterium]|nr:heavy-metal-associated domain-containing protein [Eubacteriales bacterium]MDD3572552.1 heavy-metal-associated domain-containing protein [Eubacteriales bacterium]MDD4134002.1 heavy-metal-associated domain-containing protein [Eubacteriales bacterium]NLO13486.1 heavy-metal-associated domain-containing protein [Clostridiales bacterium]